MPDVTIATEIGTLLVLAALVVLVALVVVAAHGWPGEAGVDDLDRVAGRLRDVRGLDLRRVGDRLTLSRGAVVVTVWTSGSGRLHLRETGGPYEAPGGVEETARRALALLGGVP